MIDTILVGFILVLLSIAVHSSATMLTYQMIFSVRPSRSRLHRLISVDLIVIVILAATILEGVIWAVSYQWIGAFETFEQSLYFSLVTYTTLGYGDLVLQDTHRLMGAIEAANGVIMLGWSTAIVVFTIQKLYFGSKGDN